MSEVVLSCGAIDKMDTGDPEAAHVMRSNERETLSFSRPSERELDREKVRD